jgi:hypothetical protein
MDWRKYLMIKEHASPTNYQSPEYPNARISAARWQGRNLLGIVASHDCVQEGPP